MKVKDKIENILAETFSPELLEVINESHKHKGHAGYSEGGESHFKVVISTKNIPGNSRLEKHRKIIESLGDIAKNIHALSIEMK